MTLNIKALAFTSSVALGGSFLIIGLFNLAFSGYGDAWLNIAASLYPGYDGPNGFGSVIVVTLYALVDGLIAGAIIAWLYNMFATSGAKSGA